jgi:hypothetical protein
MSKCIVCTALGKVTGDDLITLKWALDGAVAKTDIAVSLSLNGFPTSEASVRRHLKNHKGKK